MTPQRKEVAKRVRSITGRHDLWTVWSDFVEMSAISLANSVHPIAAREERYLEIAKRYEPAELQRFAEALGAVVLAFEEVGHDDVLGGVFMELELGSKWAGQFFTPFPLCRTIAALQVDDSMRALVAERGFVTASDPAVGAGAMPLALAAEMREAGLNPQTQLHVTAQDIDARAAHMAFIQFTLVGLPAIVVVGDTLRMECREVWYTPAHVLGFWSGKLRRGRALETETVETPAGPAAETAAEPDPPGAPLGQLPLFGAA